jgi:hypothetical protein
VASFESTPQDTNIACEEQGAMFVIINQPMHDLTKQFITTTKQCTTSTKKCMGLIKQCAL